MNDFEQSAMPSRCQSSAAGSSALSPDDRAALAAIDSEAIAEQIAERVGHASRDAPMPDTCTRSVPEWVSHRSRYGAAPVLPGYEFGRAIGAGGMGVVWQAVQTATRRTVAVKVLRHSSAGDRLKERFLREVQALAAVDHPNVVRYYDAQITDSGMTLVMEYIRGDSLRDRLRRGPLPPSDAAGIMLAVARSTSALHAAAILHRDLKPSNIMFRDDGTPVVIDFGLARAVDLPADEDDDQLTLTGCPMGTPGYMAPEQWRGDNRAIGPATDVWGLGATLFACLNGVPLYSTEEIVVRRIMNACAKGVPEFLRNVCERALQPDPADRYPSADAFADDLKRFLNGEGAERRRFVVPRTNPVWFLLPLLLVSLCGVGWSPTRGLRHVVEGDAVAPAREDDDDLYQTYRALSRGRPVVLVGETGSPSWSREGNRSVVVDPNTAPGVWGVTASRPRTIELLPDPGVREFTLTADMSFRPDWRGGAATPLAALSTRCENGTILVALCGHGTRSRENGQTVEFWSGPFDPAALNRSASASDPRRLFGPCANSSDGLGEHRPGSFRRLRLDVTPGRVAAFVQDAEGRWIPLGAPRPREPGAVLSIGVLCSGGTAQIRNVIITPANG